MKKILFTALLLGSIIQAMGNDNRMCERLNAMITRFNCSNSDNHTKNNNPRMCESAKSEVSFWCNGRSPGECSNKKRMVKQHCQN